MWGHMSTWRVLVGDCRESMCTLPDASVQCVVTSPPYWGLRDYGNAGQLGLEATPDAYVVNLVEVFREVRRVLRDDGVVWLNLGDSYAGAGKTGGGAQGASARHSAGTLSVEYAPKPKAPAGLKDKDLVGIPWRVAFALQADGWYLRSEVIWAKPNPMPESVSDRPTKAHEQVFLLSKAPVYYYDADAIAEPASDNKPWGARSNGGDLDASRNDRGSPRLGIAADGTRNARTVWTIATQPYGGAHFATFPPELAQRCILAGSRPGDTVLDPFAGSGTTGMVATGHGRHAILCELNPEYVPLVRERCGPMLEGAA
jgi:site-specific DNA-methyltransferase (adenine-specific)